MASILNQLKTYAIGTKSELEQSITEGVGASALVGEAFLIAGTALGAGTDDYLGQLMACSTLTLLVDIGQRVVRHQYATMTHSDTTIETSVEIFGVEVGRTKHEIKDPEPKIEHSPGLIGTIREYL